LAPIVSQHLRPITGHDRLVDPALVLRLLVTPATVLVASLVQRRLGPAAGGRLVGLPLTTGPFLVMIGIRTGPSAAATAAAGVVAGQLSVVGFCAMYASLAARVRPRTALAAATLAALLGGTVGLALHDAEVPSWLLAAGVLVAIAGTLRAVPSPVIVTAPNSAQRRWDTPMRMVASAVVVGTLVESSNVLGAGVAGLLATAPVILTIIVPATHSRAGAPHAAALARGALASLPASVVLAAILAETLGRVPVTFAVAAAALALVAVELRREAQDRLTAGQRDLELGDLALR
jgi:hypothetical protein